MDWHTDNCVLCWELNKTLDIKSIIYCLFLIKSNSIKYKIYPEQSAGDCGRRRQRQEGETGKLQLVKDRVGLTWNQKDYEKKNIKRF